jgi:signal transduction histidine kinase
MHGILYGLETCQARLREGRPISDQLAAAERLAREATAVLCQELRKLHEGVYEELDLRTALRDLVRNATDSLGLKVDVAVGAMTDPEQVPGRRCSARRGRR